MEGQHHASQCLGVHTFSPSQELLEKSLQHSKPALPLPKSHPIILFATIIDRTTSLPSKKDKVEQEEPTLGCVTFCRLEHAPPLFLKKVPLFYRESEKKHDRAVPFLKYHLLITEILLLRGCRFACIISFNSPIILWIIISIAQMKSWSFREIKWPKSLWN